MLITSYSCVTGFWKTNHLVTLGPFHFIAPTIIATLMQYPYTMPLPVLANWSAFLVQIFRPHKVMTETIWATYRAPNGRYRPEIDPNIIEMSLRLAF